jgi:RNA polymerase sigma-70 factor (ECF subfamily)
MTDGIDAIDTRIDLNVAERTARRLDLARAMDRLKPRERDMLWLAYANGSSHQEIADALGLKRASIKLLLFRARRRLANLLRDSRT